MRHIIQRIKILLFILLMVAAGRPVVWGQVTYGPSDPSAPMECGIYQWPPVLSPCPEVQIKQKHDHTPLKQYRIKGWDTVVTCTQRTLELSCMPYVPVQYFNGQYTVDTIPFDPPDTTFAQGLKMPVSTDDDFATDTTHIPFVFYFFGMRKTAFVLGANGLITFNTTSAGKYCPWKFSATLPWPNTKTGVPSSTGLGCTVANMRDAIYGIYEDTHPIAAYLTGDQGIYYGIQGEPPCRKIIASWNGIPTFPGTRNQNNRCTYQIVCYEGSNIIEVHVKRRGTNSDWQNGRGVIGVQNATGTPQTQGQPGEPNMFVDAGAHAAYYPADANLLTQSIDSSIAFRFTPQGYSWPTYGWYRIFDDGRPDVALTTDIEDTNGYYIPMEQDRPDDEQEYTACPYLSRAIVTPKTVSRYRFLLTYSDADNVVHHLADTIVIGRDTSAVLNMRPTAGQPGDTTMDICSGSHANLMIEFPPLQDTLHTSLTITRLNGGANTQLPDSLLLKGEMYEDEMANLKRIPAIMRPDSVAAHLHPGQIDSILIQFSADFVSGCPQTATFLLRTFPAYDTVDKHEICQGETFHWNHNGQDYTQSTTSPKVNIPTSVGCDSVVHLSLTVHKTSYTVDHITDCRPVTWQNGVEYTETNTETAPTDTVHLLNVAGCDSLVQLDLNIFPMVTQFEADREYFDLDHMDVVLNDISVNGETRTWYFPTADPQTGATAYYTIPYELDSATIYMVERSPHGCMDTAEMTIPFRKQVIWLPNVFTPENPNATERNALFGSVSSHVLTEETLIYNRRGERVFSCREVDCTWDGRDPNGNPCPEGSYVYIIRYTTDFEPNTTRILKGTVTLIR